MPQPDHVMALPVPDPSTLDEDLQEYFNVCVEKLGFVPNVLRAYASRPAKLRTFIATYNELMLGDSPLTKLEREMVAVVVSSANRCYYCQVAHGQAVRRLSGDPQLGEMMVMNHRVAELPERQRAMCDFAWKLTVDPSAVTATDRDQLAAVGIVGDAFFDLCDVIGFFNMSNRVATGVDMIPNSEYHALNR
ncbi:peroxidase-related enzyme [Fodinicurvata sp. EGI_FJ10296]|uniref:peroxidase-related enzyme n=1 Tax=Fodinicurvata sp. EGI_FJ10296 TaxID=3231908 RepID=UPI003454D5A4